MQKEYTAAETRGSDGVFRAGVPLAMAYVRDQDWEIPLSARDALKNGTAFGSLVMPFKGKGGCGNE